MKDRRYTYAAGIAIAGAGAALAFGSGTAQAAPLLPSPLSPVSHTLVLTPNTPAPNALLGATAGQPFYNLITLVSEVPGLSPFISNGTNGADGTGANGGNAGLLIGYGGTVEFVDATST